jgi:FkbH-like protein
MQMAAPVRLLIWDLDETFWKGTLTEGGIELIQHHHDIVRTLARRGIMSSICSKNDLERIRALLVEHQLWDYFIFPSVNWEPKGPRIATLIEAVQLRPANVMFIDDSPANLNEAVHFTPGLQTADETILLHILDNPLFAGQADSDLKRLKHYKLLETRKAAEQAAGGSSMEFLRSSEIRVAIDYDIEQNVSRAVELINRTNQLNFTKRRLPEDPEQARVALRAVISGFNTNAGLVHVSDRYGDYGYCGFFVVDRGGAIPTLLQYCFSCRILNMGVETWIYNYLGRPQVEVVGEVLTDIVNDNTEIDWITLDSAGIVG